MDKKADLAIANQTLQTELTCQRVTQVLQEEIDRLTAILNTVSALVVVLDPEGYIVRFNYACEQFTGYTFDEVRDKPLWDMFLSQNEKESVKAVFSSIQVDSTAIAKENDWVLKDGSHRRIAWSYAPLLDTSGVLKYVVGTGTNITSRKQTEEALRTLHEELESRVQERTLELAQANVALRAEISERKRAEQVSRGQTGALVKTLKILAAEPVLDNFLGYVLQAIAEQLGERSGGIWLYDEVYDTTILHIDYEDGQIRRGEQILRPGASKQNLLRQWDTDYMQLLREKKVLLQDIQDLPKSPAYAQSRAYNEKRGIKTILVVCLFFGEKFLGNITLRSTRRRNYKPEELELARVLAYQASLAIQLTRLAEQAQQSAVLEERNRLAREIHDTLAQVLTGIVVQLQAAEDVHTTDPSDRQAHITTARLLAKEGLTEARHSVRALRSHALEDTDLAGALANLTQQMATGTGLQAVCHVRGTPYLLPPDVESNLLRISQEAFTNILKHAQADEVEIELVYKPGQVRLRVQDDGQGFDPDLLSTEGFGLLGMRERAQNIGAALTITSQSGHGTEVVVTVPILSPGSQTSSS